MNIPENIILVIGFIIWPILAYITMRIVKSHDVHEDSVKTLIFYILCSAFAAAIDGLLLSVAALVYALGGHRLIGYAVMAIGLPIAMGYILKKINERTSKNKRGNNE